MEKIPDQPERIVTLRCQAEEDGVTDVVFSAALQIRIFPGRFEIWQNCPNPDPNEEPPQIIYSSDMGSRYSITQAVRAIASEAESLGRDFRDCTSVEGEVGALAELLKMAWMDNLWDVEDERLGHDDPAVHHSLKEIACLISRLPEAEIERLHDELNGFESIDPRLYSILDEIEEAEGLGCGRGGLDLTELRRAEPVVTQLQVRTNEWLERCGGEKAETSAKSWREFTVRKAGRVHRTFHTNGLECKCTSVSAGGGRIETDSERAINEILPYVDELLLESLRSEGFDELAAVLKTRTAKMRKQ